MKFLYERFNRIKNLKGDPHYIASGMAVGVFVAITPTIPFHTVLALMFAALIRGSKTAAVIGVWFSNPITIPGLYRASYKLGVLILGNEKMLNIHEINSLFEMSRVGLDITATMIVGGIVLGIIPSIMTYLLTKYIFNYINKRK